MKNLLPEPLMAKVYHILTESLAPLIRWYERRHIRRKLIAAGYQKPLEWLQNQQLLDLLRKERLRESSDSSGEVKSALCLVKWAMAERPELFVHLTTSTVSARLLLPSLLTAYSKNVSYSLVPVDIPRHVKAFLDLYKPTAAVWVESELWPNLIKCTAENQIPMALINGRMSRQSFQTWKRPLLYQLAQYMLRSFNVVLCQSQQEANKFKHLGATTADYVGNLKLGNNLPLSSQLNSQQASTPFVRRFAGKLCWTAVSTHPEEEEVILEAHASVLKAVSYDAILFLIPRHVHRANDICRMIEAHNFSYGVRVSQTTGKLAEPPTDVQVFLVNTMGEAMQYFSISSVAFVGGSLVPDIGGHNFLEPLSTGCSVIHGKNMYNFQGVYNETLAVATKAGASTAMRVVSSAEDIAKEVCEHLTAAPLERMANTKANKNVIELLRQKHGGNLQRRFTGWLGKALGDENSKL